MTFRTAAAASCSDCVDSSWKRRELEHVHRRRRARRAGRARARRGCRRRARSMPAAFANAPTSVVTVLLPLVPVMPTTRPPASRANSSISPTSRGRAPRACRRNGSASGTPGDTTTWSAPSSTAGSKPPSAVAAGGHERGAVPRVRAARRAIGDDERDGPARRGGARTTAGAAEARSRCSGLCGVGAASAQLQRGQPDQGQHERDDPEADDDLRLGPALELVVVVDRRHAEDALAGAA